MTDFGPIRPRAKQRCVKRRWRRQTPDRSKKVVLLRESCYFANAAEAKVMKYIAATIVLVVLVATTACDESDTPGDHSPDTADEPRQRADELSSVPRDHASVESRDDDRRQACYHFELAGPVDHSSTCHSHSVETKDDRLSIELIGQDAAVMLDIPADVDTGQYPFGARGDESTPGAVVELTADSDEQRHVATDGTLTIMRIDDEAVSALFDFQAKPNPEDAPNGLSVRGHLRDLSLRDASEK